MIRFKKDIEKMAKTFGLDAAVEENYAVLPGRQTPAEEARQKTLELLTSLAEQQPELFREAMEKLGIANPLAFRQAVPEIYDGQTCLMAKNYFENVALPEQVAKAREQKSPLSYLMIDIDDFKRFNGEYGHNIGDEVINFVANIIQKSVRVYNEKGNREPDLVSIMRDEKRFESPTYTFARVGQGEEFAIVLYDSSIEQAYEIGERLRKAIEEHKLETERYGLLSVTVSIGVAELEPGMNPEQLRIKADEALREAKRQGKNKVTGTQDYKIAGYLNPQEDTSQVA